MDFILQHWIQVVGVVVTPIITWILGRKQLKLELEKKEAEVKDVEIRNLATNFEVYQGVIDNLKGIIDDLEGRCKTRVSELEEDLEKMRVLNEELRRAIHNQEKYIKKLQGKLETYEKLEK